MGLHDEGRRATAVFERPTVVERDNLERPGEPIAVGSLVCTAEEMTVAYRRDRPGTRVQLALLLFTYDRTQIAMGDHVKLTPWPPESGETVKLFVRQPERFKRTQQIVCVDHLDEAIRRGQS